MFDSPNEPQTDNDTQTHPPLLVNILIFLAVVIFGCIFVYAIFGYCKCPRPWYVDFLHFPVLADGERTEREPEREREK